MSNIFLDNLIQPIRAMRLRYLPLLAIYFAYGASAFSAIGESFFIKERLDLSAVQLLAFGVWLSLPWNIKMVFGQLVDSIPILGSVRRSYIFLAGGLMACGSILMAGLAGQWHWVMVLAPPNAIFFCASLVTIIGVVLQDVVADAMSVQVVEREDRSEEAIHHDLARVQLLGRLALSLGMFIVAGLGGWLAQVVSYQTLFLLTLVIPAIGILGSLWIRLDKAIIKPVNKIVLVGGVIYAIFVISIGLSHIPYGQEIVLIGSLCVIIFLLKVLVKDIPKSLVGTIIVGAAVIFVYRAMPPAGPGAQWFMIDVLGFDKAFFGTLGQIGAGLAILGMWFFARVITERSIAFVLTWLVMIGFILSWPLIAMYYGFHEWTLIHFGFGARTIALIDTAVSSPFAQLAMIPMLALIARYAPEGNAATWFALMASFMNLALTAGTLLSQYLNKIFVVTREVRNAMGHVTVPADYSQLGWLLITVAVIGLICPLMAIYFYVRRES